MSKPSRATVCRIFAVMADRKPKTVDDLAAGAEIGIDPAYGWMRAMNAAKLVRPVGSERRSKGGPTTMLWEWNA